MALTWLGRHIWESESDLTISLRLLHVLVKPPSISGEAQEIHRTVLLITARYLEQELKDARARHPNRADIKSILEALEPYHSFQRTGATYHTELESWTANPAGGGIVASIRNTFSSLVLWSTNPEISMTPPSYTHRQLLAGIQLLGSVRVLRGLLDELKLQAETGSGDLAIDIAATLICAPLASTFVMEQASFHPLDSSKAPMPRLPILTLRDALNLERESLPKLVVTDALRAQQLVRLHRRVESLSTMPQMTTQDVANIDVNNIMQNMELENGNGQMGMREGENGDAITAAAAGGDGTAPGAANDDDSGGNINEMLNAAVAGAVAGTNGGGAEGEVGQDIGMSGMDTSIDDMLNAPDMGVGNPEFLDLDMEGML